MIKKIAKKIVLRILWWEARKILKKYNPHIISITGNVGKTSAKDAVFAALDTKFFVRKNDKSLNSEFGVPLTIIGEKTGWSSLFSWVIILLRGLQPILFDIPYPKWLVIEAGVDRPGDMKMLSRLIKSDTVVFTGIGEIPVHVEYFESAEQLRNEKMLLINSLKKDGVVILNKDNDLVYDIKNHVKGHKVVTYGFKEGSDILASNVVVTYGESGLPTGCSFKVDAQGKSVPFRVRGSLGYGHIYSVLVAVAVGLERGLNLLEIAEKVSLMVWPPGRQKIIQGIKDTIIIDDSYNASPAATELLLSTLATIDATGRKIAVLGDMTELGKFTVEAHQAIGSKAKDVADVLVVVGKRAQSISEGAINSGFNRENIFSFSDSVSAGKFLQNFIKPGDCLAIKGSQVMRMERAVEEIMASPTDKEKLLVRQEEEWQTR